MKYAGGYKGYDIIAKLPQGVDTMLGTKGIYLSGGETQRIAIARAILKDAPIVILDEATVFADPENEALVQKAFTEISKNKTVIMIARLMKRYALTQKGAVDFVKCTLITTLQNLMLMAPVAIMYYLAADLINGEIPSGRRTAYIIGCIALLILLGVVYYFQYNSSYFTT